MNYKQIDIGDPDSFEDFIGCSREEMEGDEMESWNDFYKTDYKTIEEFNQNEKYYQIVPAEMTWEEWEEKEMSMAE